MNTHFNFRYTPSVAILQLSSMQLSSTQHPLLHIHKIHHAYTIYIMHTQYIMSHQPINRDAFRLYASSSSCVELNEIQDNCMTATLGSYLKLNLWGVGHCFA